MKKYIGLTFLLTPLAAFGAFTINGTALQDATSLSEGDIGVYIVSNDGTPFSSLTSLQDGVSITASSTYGASFSVFSLSSTNTVQDVFGSLVLGSGVSTDLNVDSINTGDEFGVVVFGSSNANTLGGDTFNVFTNTGWTVGNDGDFDFPADYSTFGGSPVATGTVVPEPSTFGLLAGCFGLAWVMVRRRA